MRATAADNQYLRVRSVPDQAMQLLTVGHLCVQHARAGAGNTVLMVSWGRKWACGVATLVPPPCSTPVIRARCNTLRAAQYLSANKAKWATPADQYIHLRSSEKDARVRARHNLPLLNASDLQACVEGALMHSTESVPDIPARSSCGGWHWAQCIPGLPRGARGRAPDLACLCMHRRTMRR